MAAAATVRWWRRYEGRDGLWRGLGKRFGVEGVWYDGEDEMNLKAKTCGAWWTT